MTKSYQTKSDSGKITYDRDYIGTEDWFWNTLEETPKNPWNIEVLVEEAEEDLFKAIHLSINHFESTTEAYYSTEKLPIKPVEDLTRVFVTNHAKVPYISRSIYTDHPIGCLVSTIDSQTIKFAHWENGAIYGYRDSLNNKSTYILLVDQETFDTFSYPTVEKILEAI